MAVGSMGTGAGGKESGCERRATKRAPRRATGGGAPAAPDSFTGAALEVAVEPAPLDTGRCASVANDSTAERAAFTALVTSAFSTPAIPRRGGNKGRRVGGRSAVALVRNEKFSENNVPDVPF